MAAKLFKILFVIALSVFLLVACNNQATEEPMVTNGTVETTQPVTGDSGLLDEGELPAVPIPEQNQATTDEDVTTEPTETTQATQATQATEPTEPSVTTRPTEPKPTENTNQPNEPTETEPSETPEVEPIVPSETTPLPTTEATEPPRLDEDELPPIPLF